MLDCWRKKCRQKFVTRVVPDQSGVGRITEHAQSRHGCSGTGNTVLPGASCGLRYGIPGRASQDLLIKWIRMCTCIPSPWFHVLGVKNCVNSHFPALWLVNHFYTCLLLVDSFGHPLSQCLVGDSAFSLPS